MDKYKSANEYLDRKVEEVLKALNVKTIDEGLKKLKNKKEEFPKPKEKTSEEELISELEQYPLEVLEKVLEITEANKMEKQELSAIKVEQLNKQPIIESSVQLSEDKKWVIHKTTITDIKPVSYLQKVMGSI
jgi:hypothetical protein